MVMQILLQKDTGRTTVAKDEVSESLADTVSGKRSTAVDRASKYDGTPLDVAKRKGHNAVVALLEEHMSSKSRGAAES